MQTSIAGTQSNFVANCPFYCCYYCFCMRADDTACASRGFRLDRTQPMEEGTRIRLPPPVLVGGGGGNNNDDVDGVDEQDTIREAVTGNRSHKSESGSRSATASNSSGSASRCHSLLEEDANSMLCDSRRRNARRQCNTRTEMFAASAPLSVTADTLLLATMRQQRQQSPPRSINEPAHVYSYEQPGPSSIRFMTSESSPLIDRRADLVATERLRNLAPHESVADASNSMYDAVQSASSTPSPTIAALSRHHRSNGPIHLHNEYIGEHSINGEDLAATTTTSLSFSHSHAVSTDDSYGEVFHFVNSAHALGWRVENTSVLSHSRPATASQPKSRPESGTKKETGRSLSLRPPSAAVAEVNVHMMQQIADRFETARARK